MENINFNDYKVSLKDLPMLLSMNYISNTHGQKIDKFARAELQNGVLSTLSSFGKGVSANDFKPFNDNLDDLFIISDNALDIHNIKIYYLNGDRELKEGIVTLNGVTSVNITSALNDSIYCIWRMRNETSTDNQGTISIQDIDSNVYCDMPYTSGISANGSLTGVFSVPKGYVALFEKASLIADKGTDVKGAIFSRAKGGVFIYQKALAAYQNQGMYNDIWILADEETDILPMGIAQTGGVVYLDYTLLLMKKTHIGKEND